MKVKIKSIMCFLIYCIVFLNLGYCSMFSNNIFRMMTLATMVSGLLFLIYLYCKTNKIRISNFMYTYLILFNVLFFVNLVRYKLFPNSAISFSSIWELLLMYSNYFQILFVSLPVWFLLRKGENKLIKWIAVLGYLMLLFRLFCWIEYNFHETTIMPNFINENWRREIMGHTYTRVQGTFLDGFLFFYSFHNLVNTKKLRYIMQMAFVLFYTFFVYQSRANFLYLIVTAIVTIILMPVKKKKMTNKLLVLLLIAIVLLLNVDAIKIFISGFSVSSIKYGAGTRVRLQAILYFWNLMKQNSILFGIGFTQDSFYNGLYYMSDLGILANFFKFGIFGGIIFFMPIICAIKILLKNGLKKLKTDLFYRFFFSFAIYIIIMEINLDPYMYSMIGIMPFFIGFLLYYDSRNEVIKSSSLVSKR